MADFTRVAMLTQISEYKKYDFEMDTGCPQSENAVQFLMAQDGTNDLFVIKKARTSSGFTEVHIYTHESSYGAPVEKTTALHQTDHSWTFALGSNRDLFAIRKSDNSKDQSQLHVLSSGSDYGSFKHQSSILPDDHKLDQDFEFLVDSKDDLWVIKKQRTSITQIRTLIAASGYETIVTQPAATGLPWTDFTWSFLGVDPNEDVWVLDKKGRNLCRLTKTSNYTQKEELKLDSSKLEPPFDRRYSFALSPNMTEDAATFDLVVIKTSRTSSGNVTFWVLDKPFHHQNPRLAMVRREGTIGSLTAGDENAFSWITRSAIPVTDNNSRAGEKITGEGPKESYLRVVKKTPTGTPNESSFAEVSFFRESYRFQGPAIKVPTKWKASGGDSCEFLFAENMDMFVIKKANCLSNKVEVHFLPWGMKYQSCQLLGSTPIDQIDKVDYSWTYLLDNDTKDLICIHKSGTDSQKTECWRLPYGTTAGKHYSKWATPKTDRTTALDETDDSWDFLLAPNRDLYAIHKHELGAALPGHTKVKVLSADSEWKNMKEFTTVLPQTDYNYSFCLTTDLDLVAVQKSRFQFSADMASI